MILVDSSAWIEFYRVDGTASVQDAVAEAIRLDRAAVNGIIQVEVVPFVRNPSQRAQVSDDFSSFHWLELDREVFDLATGLTTRLRSQGLTIPATDLVIASTALRWNVRLLHVDRHFAQIARHCDLQTC
jgi:predicted nucleic acid-binding protein